MLSSGSICDDENPPWPCCPRSPAAACRAPSRRAQPSTARSGCRGSPRRHDRGAPARADVTRRRGLLRAHVRERNAAVQASGLRRRLGGSENFPPCKPLKTNETGSESRRIFAVGSRVLTAPIGLGDVEQSLRHLYRRCDRSEAIRPQHATPWGVRKNARLSTSYGLLRLEDFSQ
jgi:hypothetical protein